MIDMIRNLDNISYKEFFKFIGELYNFMGYKVEFNERMNNIDLYVSKFLEKLVIQVKVYSLNYNKLKVINKRRVELFVL